MDHYFAVDYADAREKFLDAAKAAGAKLWQFEHPLMGPGEALGTDIAWLGDIGAQRRGSRVRHTWCRGFLRDLAAKRGFGEELGVTPGRG